MSEANNLNITIVNDNQLPSLYQVSLQGDVVGLETLIRDDALVLDRVSVITFFSETPLHIAALRGHFDFVRAILKHKPELADELDSLHRVPLHWACEKGYTNIVKELLQKSPDACFSRDQEGRIPLHLAVMKGRRDVIVELVRTRPESIREKVGNGGTILHLCVRYNGLEALKLLVDTAEGHELVNDSDDHGNTILHLAAIFKQVEIMKYLLSESIDMMENALNMNGFTALDAAEHSAMDSKALEIKILLLEAGVEKSKRSTCSLNNPAPRTSGSTQRGGCFIARKCKKWWNKYIKNVENTLEQVRGNILVATTVTASMAFQAGINPPKFDKRASDQQQEIGTSNGAPPIPNISYTTDTGLLEPSQYFWAFNTISLSFSLAIIMLMLSGIPFRNKFSNFILVLAIGAIVLCISLAYYYGVKESSSFEDDEILWFVVPHRVMFYVIVCIHVSTFLMSLVFKILKYLKKLIMCLCCSKVA